MADSPALELVKTMIRAWEARDAKAVADCFAEDGVWHNIPYPPMNGRAVIAVAVERFLATATAVEFRIRHLAEIAPGVVVSERNDVFTQRDGKTLDIPVMGVFEIADGKIGEWRDYFDAAVMNA